MTSEPHGEEPFLPVPAGLIAAAAELLSLCDRFINQPGHHSIDAELDRLLRTYRRPAHARRQLDTALAATAAELHHYLHDANIIAEPVLGRQRNYPNPAITS
jgi:hypothetical protein